MDARSSPSSSNTCCRAVESPTIITSPAIIRSVQSTILTPPQWYELITYPHPNFNTHCRRATSPVADTRRHTAIHTMSMAQASITIVMAMSPDLKVME